MKRVFTGILLILMLISLSFGTACAEGLQACHRVTNTFTTTTQKNKSEIKLWHAETALPEVTDEINALAEAWAEELGPELKSAGNSGKKKQQAGRRDPLQPDRAELAELYGAGADRLSPEADRPAVHHPDL